MTAAAPSKPRVRVRTDGRIVPPAALAPVARPAPHSSFMRGGELPVFFRWQPSLRESNDDVRQAWRLAAARSVDSIQNSGWLAGATEQSAAHVVGTRLELNAKPNAEALGWTQDEANGWARRVESRFSLWAEDARACDAGGRFTFGKILVQAYRHWMATGEVLASLPWFRRPGSAFATKVKLLPAWRLSQRSEGRDLVQGIRLDGVGAARAYLLKRRTAWGGEEEVELAARDAFGRPLVIHVFDGEPDQVRGISPLTPILKVTRQFDQLADATLTAALIQAVFAAMFKSQAPSEEVLAGMQSSAEADQLATYLDNRADWYKTTDLNLGVTGKVLHGFPGDELQFFRSEHPNSTYEAFARFLLREISRACALTYEEMTGDFAGATFSSIKMGTAVVWPRVLQRRRDIVVPLAQACYEAWLEEDIEAGRTPFPGGVAGYLANREAAAQANWRGPTKPQADELKAAKAAETWQKVGVPDAVIFDELGGDPDDWYEQRKREQDRREALGLKDRAAAAPARGSSPGQDGGEGREEDEPNEDQEERP